MSDASAPNGAGAYGLSLPDLPGEDWLLEAPASWPTWRFSCEVRTISPVQGLWPDRAVFVGSAGAYSILDRAKAQTLVVSAEPLPEAAFVHPVLSLTAMVWAEWNQRLAFHAGAFIAGDGAWGLLGERGHGKSSTLAWLVAHRQPVVCDDALITDGTVVFAGPRCVDLRASAAEHFGIGVNLGRVGTRTRWRVDVAPVPPEAPLNGWVVLTWGDEVRLERLSTADAFHYLRTHRGFRITQQHPLPWLEVASKPIYLLSRPRAWSALDAAMELLLERLDG